MSIVFRDGSGYAALRSDGVYVTVDSGGLVSAQTSAAFPLPAGEIAASITFTPDKNGVWVITSLGRVFASGSAVHHGDMAGVPLNGPVIDSVVTPSGNGYYMVASDGGVFAFGDASFAGSMGGLLLNAPVNGLVPDPDSSGYWLVAADGGVFAFGDVVFKGSLGNNPPSHDVISIAAAFGDYAMLDTTGVIYPFGALPSVPTFDGCNPPTVGTGDSVITLGADAASTPATLAHDGSSSFIVWARDAQGDRLDLLVNEIGAYDGVVVAPSNAVIFEINADGARTVT
ncbi:MAG: hypothetical protein GY698_24900 [Actinomycetia bacterium]|nr:hypothetical protein [Actinomycetes bacterium]